MMIYSLFALWVVQLWSSGHLHFMDYQKKSKNGKISQCTYLPPEETRCLQLYTHYSYNLNLES